MNRKDFITAALAAARSARAAGAPINPAVAAAMAAHETGFGRSVPPGSNNVLGIKAGTSWTGPTVNAQTHEYTPAGERYDTRAAWRVYPDVEACFRDYGDTIERLWWYQDAEEAKDDAWKFLNALKPIYNPSGEVVEPGYFTDPNYVLAVWNIVNEYGLLQEEPEYDRLVLNHLSWKDWWSVAGALVSGEVPVIRKTRIPLTLRPPKIDVNLSRER